MQTRVRHRRFRRLGAWAAVAAVAGLLGTGAMGCRAATSGAGTATAGGREGSVLPELRLKGLDGREISLSSLRGKVVVVDFWDTWCGPCLRALPHLKALSLEHPEDVVVIAIALGQEGEAKVRDVVTKQGLPFPVALWEAQGDLTPAFGNVDQLPTTFLIGPDGVIRRRWTGAQSLPTYGNAVRALLPS